MITLIISTLTGLFLLTELSIFILQAAPMLKAYSIIQQHTVFPMVAVGGLVQYGLVFIGVHLLFALGLIFLACALTRRWSWAKREITAVAIGLWVIAVTTLLMANQWLFPNSSYAQLTATFTPTVIASTLTLAGCAFFLVLTTVIFPRITAGLFFLLIALTFYPSYSMAPHKKSQQPNVILIGIDSLRPDHLAYSPTVKKFLQNSMHFTQAYTPLSRTFPAWMSILTGQNPREHGARYDLIDPKQLKLTHTLGNVLKKHGYYRVYATDDKRFSNIDEYFGFDKLIGPRMGINDFILGTFSDFPLINLLVNTRVGKVLLPHLHGNRSAYKTYLPNTFLNDVAHNLDSDKPLFLAIHLCLPHWPYIGSEKPVAKLHEQTAEDKLALYRAAIQSADQQFAAFVKQLKQQHLLDNAIVVVLSDHGEGFALPSDHLTADMQFLGTPSQRQQLAKQLWGSSDEAHLASSLGHGTDVLSETQLRVVLGLRRFGKQKLKAQTIDTPSSLIDIKPTILALLGISDSNSTGANLTALPQNRTLYFETGFAPEAIKRQNPNVSDLVNIAYKYFRIDPKTTRLIVKKTIGEMIISSKQTAQLHGNVITGYFPGGTKLVVNKNNRQWHIS